MSLTLQDKLRVAMRSNLWTLMGWYALRGLTPWRFAREIAKSGRAFDVTDGRLGAIAFEVLIEDGYRMHQRRLAESDVVLDIGGYLGFFGLAAHACGSRRIVSFEPQVESFEILSRNYGRMSGAEARHGAVFRSDRPTSRLHHSGAGCSGAVLFSDDAPMHWHDGVVVPTPPDILPQTVDAVTELDELLEEFPRVRLLKLDCEGSEFPILLTSRRLDRVEEIVGECHEIPSAMYARMTDDARIAGMSEYRLEDLVARLNEAAFDVETKRLGAAMHLFHARRR